MIQTRGLNKEFGSVTALNDVSLDVGEGEVVGLLGRNGAGKTTLIDLLLGLTRPTSGDVRIAGTTPHDAVRDARIGAVMQTGGLLPDLTVRDTVAMIASTHHDPMSVDSAIEAAGLQDIAGRRVGKCSGGQQQRVAIARALVMEPNILLLDEPLSNLDARLRKQLRGQLKDIQTEVGITTVYVTHDQEEALSMSDRIAVLNEGRIEQVGTPRELYEKSETEFVCTFLGQVNPLSEAQIDELNNQGARLSPAHQHYIRPERLTVQRDNTSRIGNELRLPATITGESYLGDHSVIEVNTMGSSLRVNVSGLHPLGTTNSDVTLLLDDSAISSFDADRRRVAE